jgi:hypothetical protein
MATESKSPRARALQNRDVCQRRDPATDSAVCYWRGPRLSESVIQPKTQAEPVALNVCVSRLRSVALKRYATVIPISRNSSCMSCQQSFLAAGLRSKYAGWYVHSTRIPR